MYPDPAPEHLPWWQEWPERPAGSVYWYSDRAQGGGFWAVPGLPPRPWPGEGKGYAYPRALFGPQGTSYGPFSSDQVVDRMVEQDLPQGRGKVLKLLRKLGLQRVDGAGHWTVPPNNAGPAIPVTEWSAMRFIRTTVHAKLNTDEEIAHVLHWLPNSGPNATLTPEQVLAFGNSVRDAWANFLNLNMPGAANPAKRYLAPGVVYDEVRSALVELVAGAPKPNYVTPTVYSPFAANLAGTSVGAQLPNEVAMVLSLNSNLRGPRNRGRLYLGGLSSDLMASGTAPGLFGPALVQQIGASFGTNFVAPLNAGTVAKLVVASPTYGTSVFVQGVRMGVVPDSQRRRRKRQKEAYVQAWGTAQGQYVPAAG